MKGTKTFSLIPLMLLLVPALIYIYYAYISIGSFGGEDSFNHYLISRYSFNHPILLLDQWGKPVYTLLSAPFAQFGFLGFKIFNCLVALITSYFSFRSAEKLGYDYAWMTIPLLTFSPLFFAAAFSGLTEILFASFVAIGLYLVLCRRSLASALLISFLPYVRTEGFVVLAPFAVFFIIEKEFKALPALLFGSILYNVLGFLNTGDALWIVGKNPYFFVSNVYGKGTFWHFFQKIDEILGPSGTLLFIVGICFFLIRLVGEIRDKDIQYPTLVNFFIVFGAFSAYFLAHVVLWWQGMFGSLGLTRVMAAVAPLSALACLYGLNAVLKIFKNYRLTRLTLAGAILFSAVIVPFRQYDLPFKLNPEQELMSNVALWCKQKKVLNNKMLYFFPYLSIALERDPFNDALAGGLWEALDPNVPDNTIVIWDSHFGPNECRLALSELLSDKRLRLLKVFKPAEPTRTLNDYLFEVYVFQKRA